MFVESTVYCPRCSCAACILERAERARWIHGGNTGTFAKWGFRPSRIRFTDAEVRQAGAEMPPKPRSAYMDPTPYKPTYL